MNENTPETTMEESAPARVKLYPNPCAIKDREQGEKLTQAMQGAARFLSYPAAEYIALLRDRILRKRYRPTAEEADSLHACLHDMAEKMVEKVKPQGSPPYAVNARKWLLFYERKIGAYLATLTPEKQ